MKDYNPLYANKIKLYIAMFDDMEGQSREIAM